MMLGLLSTTLFAAVAAAEEMYVTQFIYAIASLIDCSKISNINY